MGIKIVKKILTIFLYILLCFSWQNCAFAGEVGDIVRVGLTDNNFQNVLKQDITIFGTAECDICDKISRKVLIHIPANSEINIKNGLSGLTVTYNFSVATLRDFVIICPSGLLGVKDLKRKGKQALYHGAFEVTQSKDHKGFYLITPAVWTRR